LFTHNLIKGLENGAADLDGDGWITLDEWYDFAYEQIINQTPNQTPKKWAYNQQGDLVIAKNRNPKSIAAGQFSSVRAEAVQELGRLLRGKDKGLRLVAYEALAQIASLDDSRSVASSAAKIVSAYDRGMVPAPQIPALQEMAVEEITKPEPPAESAQKIEGPKSDSVDKKPPVTHAFVQEEVVPKPKVVAVAEVEARQSDSPYQQSASAYPAPLGKQGQPKPAPRSPLLILGLGGLGVIGLGVIILLLWGSIRGFGASPVPEVTTPTPTDSRIPTQTQPIQETEITNILEPMVIPSEEIAVVPPLQITDTPIPTPLGGGSGRIAYASSRNGNPQIYSMNIDGGGITRLTNSSAEDSFPVWSPDGRYIVFITNRDGNFEIYRMNADGSGLTRLTDTPAEERHPSWSPDGGLIAFTSNLDGGFKIYVMDGNGDSVSFLMDDEGENNAPAWSP
jgi:hypothetical protein